MDKIDRLQNYKVRRTDLMPRGKVKRPDSKLLKQAERASPLISRYDSFDRPQPTIPANKKNRKKPPTEAELKDVQNSWQAVSAITQAVKSLSALGLTLSYSVNTETGEVTVDPLGEPNRRGRNLLYRLKVQAIWLKKAATGSAKQRRAAQERLYEDLL